MSPQAKKSTVRKSDRAKKLAGRPRDPQLAKAAEAVKAELASPLTPEQIRIVTTEPKSEAERARFLQTVIAVLGGDPSKAAPKAEAVPSPAAVASELVSPTSYSAVVSPTSYAGRFRDDPASVETKAERIRYSGNVTGHVMHIRAEERFQVDLTDELTLAIRQVFVPAIVTGRKITSLQRSVAFREAVKLAGWTDRAELTDKGRIAVRKLEKKSTVFVRTRSSEAGIVAPDHTRPLPVEAMAEAEAEHASEAAALAAKVALAEKTLADARAALKSATESMAAALAGLRKG